MYAVTVVPENTTASTAATVTLINNIYKREINLLLAKHILACYVHSRNNYKLIRKHINLNIRNEEKR